MGRVGKNTKKVKQDIQSILKSRFDYLSSSDRDKLLTGNDFVEIPAKELSRLRIDAYPYIM